MMQWAVLAIFVLFLGMAYIILQGTRAAIAWRKAAAAGDVKVIRDIVEDALGVWRSSKRPREVPTDVWRGVQSMQLVDVAPGFVRVSCQAQSEYKMYEGRWIEVRNPLQEGIAIAAKAAEMLFYELPHYRPENVQVDVYTSFREDEGFTANECILSMETTRELARTADWDEWTSDDIADHLGARYRLGERGQPLPIEVEPPPDREEAESEASEAGSAS
jgi:hypothetical protein